MAQARVIWEEESSTETMPPPETGLWESLWNVLSIDDKWGWPQFSVCSVTFGQVVLKVVRVEAEEAVNNTLVTLLHGLGTHFCL